MFEFEDTIESYLNRSAGGKLGQPVELSNDELTDLIIAAKTPKDAHGATWAKFYRLMMECSGMKAPMAKATFKECRIHADLGGFPYTVTDFIPMFLKSRRYCMKFSGDFTNKADYQFIYNEMVVWSHGLIPGSIVYSDNQIAAAFQNWQVTEKDALLSKAYESVRHSLQADEDELRAFAQFITAATDDDDKATKRDVNATLIALRNFIYRVKNHMRGKWYHGIHMMPVLYGPQGSGKTTAVRHLLSPIADYTSAVGFDIFDHDAKTYSLSVIPVLFFDEMAGISKAENEKLKDIMHTENRELRQIYGKPVHRTLVSSFIGCSNRDISTLIRDETGNRRYLQIETPRISRDEIRKFDALAMWRCVDEDGEPPLYAHADDLRAVMEVQAGQRHVGKVDGWLSDTDRVPTGFVKSSSLFSEYYLPWLRDMYPGQDRFENVVAFGKELARLIRDSHPRLLSKHDKSNKVFEIGPKPVDADMPKAPPQITNVVPIKAKTVEQRIRERIAARAWDVIQ